MGAARVFPTPVGVFHYVISFQRPESGLPHARGGVSELYDAVIDVEKVFPTPVGVFLRSMPTCHARSSLPHARGGVSPQIYPEVSYLASSPRPWGCFCHVLMEGQRR